MSKIITHRMLFRRRGRGNGNLKLQPPQHQKEGKATPEVQRRGQGCDDRAPEQPSEATSKRKNEEFVASSTKKLNSLLITRLLVGELGEKVNVGNDTLANINVVGKRFLKKFRNIWPSLKRNCKGVINGISDKPGRIQGAINLTIVFSETMKKLFTFYMVPEYDGELLLS